MREKPGSISRSVVQGFVTANELADACVASSEMALQKSACAERLAEVPKTVGIGVAGSGSGFTRYNVGSCGSVASCEQKKPRRLLSAQFCEAVQ